MTSSAEARSARVRRAESDQWQVYREVRLAALAEAPSAFSSTLARELSFEAEVWQQRLSAPTAATFIAWDDGGEPVGTATGKVEDPDDDLAVPGGWQLVAMWVSPSRRGSGVADALVEAVAVYAAEQGAHSLVLWVTEVNGRARALYERLGFASTGARQLVRPQEPDHWEEQMIRPLR